MNIYFAGSIRGGRAVVGSYSHLIEHQKKFGTVLTVHVSDDNLLRKVDDNNTDIYIPDRDMA
ncbi:MAG: hypothetical protein K0B07_02185 [DPANN group archaeon]|nr:hypothetical protein [DPANN group archaeon]